MDIMANKALSQQNDIEDVALVSYPEHGQDLIDQYQVRAEVQPIKLQGASRDSSTSPFESLIEKDALLKAKYAEAFGTADTDLQAHLVFQAWQCFPGVLNAKKDHKEIWQACNTALAFLAEIKPRNPIEAMLATQMLATHNSAMESFTHAMLAGQTFEGRKARMDYATKMTRTFAAQMDALKKYREGASPKMTIGHVHVNDGAQAVVGQVNPGKQDSYR
jgi:hypothetical protein